MYYSKVKNNIEDFNLAVNHLQQKHMLINNDSILLRNGEAINYDNGKCLYYEKVHDSLIRRLMIVYNLKRICFSRLNNEFFDSVITFHKDYNPLFGKRIIISYDWGKSEVRDKTKEGNQPKDEKIKIVNNVYLYRIKAKPAFGE
jgi:hypothetical protein